MTVGILSDCVEFLIFSNFRRKYSKEQKLTVGNFQERSVKFTILILYRKLQLEKNLTVVNF